MSDKLYAIILDQLDPSFDPSALRDVMKTFGGISHWWNHMPSCFLVNSPLSAEQLADWLRKHTGDLGFLVIETNPHNSEGHLPERSWKWLRQRESELTGSN
jgi:hypothetical protein